jgi:tetratricopeptide (TPR) repeat protein
VQGAFARSGKASAGEWFRLAAANLDDYTNKWVAERTVACEATRLHREQSEEVLDLRMTCLDGRLREVQSLVTALGSGDAESVQEAPRATAHLGSLEECGDVAALRSPTPRPRDGKERAQAELLEARLADVQALYNLGKLTAAAASSETLVRDAVTLGFAPLLSKAYLWQGRTFADNSDSPRAIAAFHAAFAAALGSGEAIVLDDAAVRLAQEYVYARKKTEYQVWYDIAKGGLQRFPNPNRRDFLEQVRCVSLSQDGKVQLSLQCLRDHAAKLQRTNGLTDWELTWLGLAAADAGQLAESVDWVRRGVAYSAAHEGKTHPRTLELRAYLVRSLVNRGDTDEALREGRDLLQVVQREGLAGTALESKALLYLGVTLRELGKLDEAAPALEHAQRESRDVEIKSEASPELVRLLLDRGRTRQALALAHQALDEERKTLTATHPYVLADSLALAMAQLRSGQGADAVRTLEQVLAATDGADVSPFLVAELKAELAVALPPKERVRARALATEARDFYTSGVTTKRLSDRARKMDERLAVLARGD